MKKLRVINILTMLSISGLGVTSSLSSNEIESVKAEPAIINQYEGCIDIYTGDPSKANPEFNGWSNLRLYVYDIKTVFDKDNVITNLSVEKYDTLNTKRIYFKNSNNLAGEIKAIASSDMTLSSDDKSYMMRQVDNSDYYYADIENIYSYVSFSNDEISTEFSNINNLNYYKRVFDHKLNRFTLNDNVFVKDDNNSRYCYSSESSVYDVTSDASAYLYNELLRTNNKGIRNKTELVFPQGSKKHIRLPWFISSCTVDLICTVNNSDTKNEPYVARMNAPAKLVRKPGEYNTRIEMFYSRGDTDIQIDHINKEVIFGGLVRDKAGAAQKGQVIGNGYRFIKDYFNIINKDSNDSICSTLVNADANKIREYGKLIAIKNNSYDYSLGNQYDSVMYSIDKYDEFGEVTTIMDTINYIELYLTNNSNKPLLTFLNDKDHPEVGITLVIIMSSTLLIILFTMMNKYKTKRLNK